MNILIDICQESLEFSDASAFVLVCTRHAVFRSVVERIFNAIAGNTENKWAISIDINNGERVSGVDTAIAIESYFSFDFARRAIAGRVMKAAEQGLLENHEALTAALQGIVNARTAVLGAIRSELYDVALKDFDSAAELVKLFGVSIDEERYGSVLDRLYGVLDVVSSFGLAKLVVTSDLSGYFSVQERNELYKYAEYKGLHWLDIRCAAGLDEKECARGCLVDEEYEQIPLM